MNITSKIVALSSAVAFALQIALALLMLRYFSPEEVGMFSVISQIGFFWTTLALAQTPLRLLANHGDSVLDDAKGAWVSSMQRFVWLLPVAALAVWWSGLSFVSALLWALLLSLCQLTWMLAQSMRLRMTRAWAQVGVRVLPPFIALLVAATAVYMQWTGPALLSAALLGYAAGAAWLLPALLTIWRSKFEGASTKPDEIALSSALQDPSQVATASVSGDNRSAALRMGHTLADALLATAIVVVWQRLYGAQETGWMAAPLRVMGFVPAVVHMAWAQVLLAQPQHARTNPLWVGLCGVACVALLGAGCAVTLEMGWLGEQWHGVWPYLLPLMVWQGSACLVAAFSHLPFQAQSARMYSWLCIGVAILQGGVLLIPTFTNLLQTPFSVFVFFSICSSMALLGICWWQRNLSKSTHYTIYLKSESNL
jgi:hypothetical protein